MKLESIFNKNIQVTNMCTITRNMYTASQCSASTILSCLKFKVFCDYNHSTV